MIRFVGIDLDGTLLDSEKRLPSENAKAIEDAEKKGVIVTIFTGRSWISAKEYFDAISSDIPAVFQNGAYITTLKTREVLRKILLDHEDAVNMIKFSRDLGLFTILFTNFKDSPDMIYDSDFPEGSNYMQYFGRNSHRMIRVRDSIPFVGEAVSEVAVIGNLDKIEALRGELGGKCSFILSTVFTDNREAFAELYGPGCGKEIALEFLLERLKIPNEEAAFIGDNYNDLEALKTVGHPIVMGNHYAPEELTNVANFVTASNDENGVAKAFREYILKN